MSWAAGQRIVGYVDQAWTRPGTGTIAVALHGHARTRGRGDFTHVLRTDR